MNENSREHLSALMDGELKGGECDFLLRRLTGDEELAGRWRRYHLVRACMHNELSTAADLADRVTAALDAEPLDQAESVSSRWLRPIGGAAIAASVAVVALIGINSSLLDRGQPELIADQPGFVSQATPFDMPFTQPLVPVSFSETSAADRQRINGYLLRHNQASGAVGFVSYVPIVVSSRTPMANAEAETAADEHRADER